VSPNYYEEELNYQHEIDGEQNAIADRFYPVIKLKSESLDFIFPTEKISDDFEGQIIFYRPSNKKLDLKLPIKLKDSKMNVSKDNLVPGRYDLKIFWVNGGKSYSYKKSILL
jgi:hypothetical protein